MLIVDNDQGNAKNILKLTLDWQQLMAFFLEKITLTFTNMEINFEKLLNFLKLNGKPF